MLVHLHMVITIYLRHDVDHLYMDTHYVQMENEAFSWEEIIPILQMEVLSFLIILHEDLHMSENHDFHLGLFRQTEKEP